MKEIYPYRYSIGIFVIVAMLVAFLVSWLTPKKFLAIATALPASSYSNDRSRLFNENLEALYSSLGNPDDLDYVIGTAKLDTVYLFVTDSLFLATHYDVKETGEAARRKAASLLQKNSRIEKSGYGELKVKVWDKDRGKAAVLANAILAKLGAIHRDLQSVSNRATLQSLERQKTLADTTPSAQRIDYDRLINEYRMLTDAAMPVIIPVEFARVPEWPDKPRTWRNVTLAAGLALVFSIILAAFMAGRKRIE
jgi:hypothetical protein